MTNDKRRRLTVIVSGLVQGVGYRAFVRRYAKNNDITGYAENTSDGRVEVIAESTEKELIHLLYMMQKGPSHAKVTNMDTSWGEASNLEDFFIY